MAMPETIFPEYVLIQAILAAGIVLNFVLLLKRRSWKSPLTVAVFLSTFLILILTIPVFYGSFELSIHHFLEHIFLKVLFILVAIQIQIHLTKSANYQKGSSKACEINERLFNRSIERTSALQDAVEKIYVEVEVGLFDRDLQNFSEKTTSFLENVLSSAEKAFDIFWNGMVKKSEVALDMLRNVQTGLLNINLIFVITFLGASFILIVLMWR